MENFKKLKCLTTISNKCPYSECDGTGFKLWLYRDLKNDMDVEISEPCKCLGGIETPKIKKGADIPLEFRDCTVKSFDTKLYNDASEAENAKKCAVNYILNFETFKIKGIGLYLYSKEKGSGKTRLACSIANALMNREYISIKFIRTLDLLSIIRDTYKKDSGITERETVDRIKKVKFLILDDIGAEKPTEWVCGEFLKILDYRISNKLITFFTSNLHREKLKLDGRIIDRIVAMTLDVHLPEESVRRSQSKKQNVELSNLLRGE